MAAPRTQYARSRDVSIAYSVTGDGPVDIVFNTGFMSHLELVWDEPACARLFRRLGSFARLILFDKRGVGMSDRSVGIATLEERADDIRAVMDAAGSRRAHLIGVSEGTPLAIVFAAGHPDRVQSLILIGGYARTLYADNYPWAPTEAAYNESVDALERYWGRPVGLELWAPTVQHDARLRRFWANYLRNGGTPGSVRALMEMNRGIDVREALPAVRVPTLILHQTGDRIASVQGARYTASRIPGATYVELPGDDHLYWINGDRYADEIEEFITGSHGQSEPDRVLATVLYTDIVDSTVRGAELGDRAWSDVLETYQEAARRQVDRHRGRIIKWTGDGVLATFDGPARAIRCAQALRDDARHFGIDQRAGLHTGECELVGEDIAGIAVNIGARVTDLAAGGEILVSSTVRDLVTGSGIAFRERGAHVLKGVPGEWRVFAVESA
jgi:class 3 adenylate cyclase